MPPLDMNQKRATNCGSSGPRRKMIKTEVTVYLPITEGMSIRAWKGRGVQEGGQNDRKHPQRQHPLRPERCGRRVQGSILERPR